MAYPSLQAVVAAAEQLTYAASGDRLLRTNGLWHVLAFLRHCRVSGTGRERELSAYDLAEAVFDLNGIELPITADARNVYYEPGATGGRSPKNLFRHQDGPRQTYLNRIQTGLSGVGPRQPNLFRVNGTTLPVRVSLTTDWIDQLRSLESNSVVLDSKLHQLITWVFRFGVPRVGLGTSPIAFHTEGGQLRMHEGLQLAPLPSDPDELAGTVSDYFGLQSGECQALLPRLSEVLPSEWTEDQGVTYEQLGTAIRKRFGQTRPSEGQAPGGDYALQWPRFESTLVVPLTGIDDAVSRSVAALRAGKFVVFVGPPGSGKTALGRLLCEHACALGAPGFDVSTATSEWSTFETMGGYTPDPTAPGTLIVQRGLVLESLSSGRWLLIDELNRADIDKAFGELFTLFSREKVVLPLREKGKPIVLLPPGRTAEPSEAPVSQHRDWRMIGTMNTFDKASLFQLSYAFMRRFAFVNVPVPSPGDYEALIVEFLSASVSGDSNDAFRSDVAGFLNALFCASSGLTSIGLNVGPAIPEDIAEFIGERRQSPSGSSLSAKEIVLEAIEMYLYPQFEGKDRLHERILSIVQRGLSLDETATAATGAHLATWTGFAGEGP